MSSSPGRIYYLTKVIQQPTTQVLDSHHQLVYSRAVSAISSKPTESLMERSVVMHIADSQDA